MIFEDYSKKVTVFGFLSGLIVGQLMGIGIVLTTGLDIISGLTNGAGAGIIVAMMPVQVLIKDWMTDKRLLVPFGMGWGTLVGILVGVVASWSLGFQPLYGFSYGAIGGFVTGIVVCSILWFVSRDKGDSGDEDDEEELVEISAE